MPKPKLRKAMKMSVDPNSKVGRAKVTGLYCIEIYDPRRRHYYPLGDTKGTWLFDTEEKCDEAIAEISNWDLSKFNFGSN